VSVIRIYIDEDSMSRAFVLALRSRNIDVLTALEARMIEREDRAHLMFAAAQGRVLYTFNVRDFYALHTQLVAEGGSHSGLILARQQQFSIGEQARRLLKLIATRSAEEMESRVEFLSAWG
jgi:Domain of unknown function (DUF5615)